MKRNEPTDSRGKSPISASYKRVRKETGKLDGKIDLTEVPSGRGPEPGIRPGSLAGNDDSSDKKSPKGTKSNATRSSGKVTTDRDRPPPPWECETATFNPKCKHCNRRWLLETQEIGEMLDSEEYSMNSCESTEEY